MKDETYNGWTNWDTWNANLWITNTEETYEEAKTCTDYHNLRDFWEHYFEGTDNIKISEVNFKEIFEALKG